MRQQKVEELQAALDRSVRVLLELKGRKGLTQKDHDEIDDTVKSLQDVNRKLPRLNALLRKRLVVQIIGKLIGLWRRFRTADQ